MCKLNHTTIVGMLARFIFKIFALNITRYQQKKKKKKKKKKLLEHFLIDYGLKFGERKHSGR